jgi:nickel/cobalt transporter (NiCoT) family protein
MQLDLQESLLPRRTKPDTTFARAASLVVGAILFVTGGATICILTLLPSMGSLGILAYSFGCRHGVDADHIAVIDNATRQQLLAGRRSMTVGIFFSLGHCTIVLLLCGFVLVTADASSSTKLEEWTRLGDAIGPWLAASVLLCIGSLNLYATRSLFQQWRERKARGHQHEIASLVTNCCPTLLGVVDTPAKVFWVGLLFGLGLDTATEICLLTMTALAQGVPRAATLLLPLLFATGMALVDSLNGLVMLWAYEWAEDNGPMHRLFFSLFLTVASAVLALIIGCVEALGQAGEQFGLCDRPFWGTACWLSTHMELLGVAAVAAFMLAITCSVLMAHRCVPSQTQIDEDARLKLSQSLQKYVQKGEYIVRFE